MANPTVNQRNTLTFFRCGIHRSRYGRTACYAIATTLVLCACVTGDGTDKPGNEHNGLDGGKTESIIDGEAVIQSDSRMTDEMLNEDGEIAFVDMDSSEETGETPIEDSQIEAEVEPLQKEREVEVDIAKWFDDHTAAISLTYDTGSPRNDPLTIDAILSHDFTMDYELVVTKIHQETLDLITTIMIPS